MHTRMKPLIELLKKSIEVEFKIPADFFLLNLSEELEKNIHELMYDPDLEVLKIISLESDEITIKVKMKQELEMM